jgi:kinesin family protein 4/21/27
LTFVLQEGVDIRSKYENRIKKLLNELSEVKRKHFESTQAASNSRAQHDNLIRKMKHSIQNLKDEKNRMVIQLKEEVEKIKTSEANSRRELMILRKKERKAVEMAKKLEKNNEVQVLNVLAV